MPPISPRFMPSPVVDFAGNIASEPAKGPRR
jgi:hypothetical protein